MNEEYIDLREVFGQLWKRRKLFVKVLIITFVLSCIWIVPFPRTYSTTITLSPEASTPGVSGTLGSLASSFGIDLNSAQSADAIFPVIYPDVIGSTAFTTSLFDVHVKSIDGVVDTTYYHYLNRMQKQALWLKPVEWVRKQLRKLIGEDAVVAAGNKQAKSGSSVFLSRRQKEIIDKINAKVGCRIDKKTEVITITVTDQDPLISASMADSVRVLLQDYITAYRTKKARVDVEFYTELLQRSRQEYDDAVRAYSRFSDSHQESSLQSTLTRQDVLNNEMQMKLNTYNLVASQLQAARAKLQERTPAFTVIQPAVVPLKASAPKRMIFVLMMLVLAFMGTCLWIAKDFVKAQLVHIKKTDAEAPVEESPQGTV